MTLDERPPPLERSHHRGLERILHHVVEDHVDLGPFENEYDRLRGQVGGVRLETPFRGIERRPFGEQLRSLLLSPVFQTGDDCNLVNDSLLSTERTTGTSTRSTITSRLAREPAR